jgi:hypothetical protein
MKLRVVHLLLAACVAVLFAACKEGNIYYTLENEVKVEDLSLPNDITLFDVTKIGGAGGSYFAAAGKIWTVADSAAEWDVNALVAPPNPGNICTALVASPFGTSTLYGGFISTSGGLGLYESTAAPSFHGQPAETLPVAGSQIALLKAVNDGASRLIVVTAAQPSAGANFVYGIVYAAAAGSYAAATFDVTRPDGDEKKPIYDVIYAGGTFSAWFATEGTKLYTNSGSGFGGDFTVADMTGMTAGETLTGLFYDDVDDTVYVASKSGVVYYSVAGAAWIPIAAPAISGTHPPLTRFEMLHVTTERILLVGSDGYGYYRLPTNPIGSLTRFPTTTSDLYSASVMKFFYDADLPTKHVFACTAMGGLWRGAVAADGTIDWNLE